LALCAALASVPARAGEGGEGVVWVDDAGRTHLTNAPDAVAPEAVVEGDALRVLWDDGVVGPPLVTPPGASGTSADRVQRLLDGVAADLERGEQARAEATLRSILRLDPRRAEPHWYLALLAQRRGRHVSAKEHLHAFLSRAGEHLADWRAQARARLASIDDEMRLADGERLRGPLRLVSHGGTHFRVELDSDLEQRPGYAERVLDYLEQARAEVARQLGVVPAEALGVVFYGRASYQRAHRHRFSFRTVGFFDGRIHVSSPADPGRALRSLLYHEYTHAVYREQTGGDRPYWLNEGIAELVERRSQAKPTSTRSERASLRTRIAGGDWIPLRRLGPGFSGLRDDDARAAYLQSIVAAEWIEAHTDAAARARLLRRLGQGWSADQALFEAVGLDTAGLDRALRTRIDQEFPRIAP